MEDTKRAELDAAYQAVMALLDVADTVDVRFRVAVMGESAWVSPAKETPNQGEPSGVGEETCELVRCPASLMPAVFRRVMDIAETPLFGERCLNSSDEPPVVDPAEPRYVIYLAKWRVAASSGGPVSEPVERRVLVSGLHPKVGKRNSA